MHTFIVPIHLILESFVFYLLDDCSEGGLRASLTLHLFCVYILLLYVSFLFFWHCTLGCTICGSLELANIMTESFPVASGNFIETQDPDVCRIVRLNLELIVIYLSTARHRRKSFMVLCWICSFAWTLIDLWSVVFCFLRAALLKYCE
jgi:hypothetical protein